MSTKDQPVHIFKGQQPANAVDENAYLPVMSNAEHVVRDYATTSLSLKAHPVSFIRKQLESLHILTTAALTSFKNAVQVKVAGLVLVRQRSGNADGVCFMTIEDETGFANLVIFEKLFEQYRKEILQSKLIIVEGEVIHVIVKPCYDISKLLRKLTPSSDQDPSVSTLAYPDEKLIPTHVQNKRLQVRHDGNRGVFHKGRNFK